MKSVLISTQPRWCKLTASGKKRIEVRKTKPKIEVPFKAYIYCTKGDPVFTQSAFCDEVSNGKVIGEFVCDKIDEYRYGVYDGEFAYHIPTVEGEKTCMEYTEAEEYGNGKPLYFWHISDLVIYDKPMELSEFFYACDKPKGTDCSVCLDHRENKCKAITRPPQSWCYVEERSRP